MKKRSFKSITVNEKQIDLNDKGLVTGDVN